MRSLCAPAGAPPASPSGKDHPVRWEKQTRVAPRPPPPGSEYSDYQYFMRANEKQFNETCPRPNFLHTVAEGVIHVELIETQ